MHLAQDEREGLRRELQATRERLAAAEAAMITAQRGPHISTDHQLAILDRQLIAARWGPPFSQTFMCASCCEQQEIGMVSSKSFDSRRELNSLHGVAGSSTPWQGRQQQPRRRLPRRQRKRRAAC